MSYESPPFEPGTTLGVSATTDGNQWLGKRFWFRDQYWDSNKPKVRTEHIVTRMAVRNTAAIALRPKRYVTFKAGTNFTEVDGYGDVTAEVHGAFVDEFLPAAGAAVNDIFYVVVHGPGTALLDIAAAAGNLIPENAAVVALTAATSGATTAGRIKVQDQTGATAVLGAELNGRLGYALSAKTTNNTAADILLFVKPSWY